ncbi:prolyl hydroxylase family protein [Sphingomonas soli]|uniref:prolyl hydroxylase family protein n=1 Tax=Sphingomonas soli TaxID=266127 RepID=UPI00082C207F|nr:2OG-Fe(II) oxygenase [Sphingomonas soli]
MGSALEPDPNRAAIGHRVATRLAASPHVHPCPIETTALYYAFDFIERSECDALIAMIDAGARPSEVLADGDATGVRTSETCHLDPGEGLVRQLNARIADLLGIDGGYGEPLHGQRYLSGQHYRMHCDFFRDDQRYWPEVDAEGGQRTWTVMIYLNAVAQGGETAFPAAGIRFTAAPGLLLAWNNMLADGAPNPATLHEALPVQAGSKYIVTKWFRERAWAGSPT